MVSLSFDHVSVSYPRTGKVIDDASFRIEDGGITCILGPTGCGKTTTLRLLSGIIHPNEGKVIIDGRPVSESDRTKVGYVFQEPRLLPWRSVRGNVEFSMEAKEHNEEERKKRSLQLLTMVGLGDREDDNPSNLSGGEKQRVALARALAPNPTLLLMDEPFSSIDVATRRRVLNEFLSVIRQAGKTTIFVTHDLFEALYLADRLIVYSTSPAKVKADMTIEDGRPRDLSNQRMMRLREKIVDLLEE